MTETLVQGIIHALSGTLSKEAIVFVISMIPILELRGALLVAGPVLGVPVAKAIPLCVIGNIVPVPFILLLITPIFTWLKGTKTFKPMVHRLEARAMSKSDQIEKYEFWGLVLFGNSASRYRSVDRIADRSTSGCEVPQSISGGCAWNLYGDSDYVVYFICTFRWCTFTGVIK